MLFWAKVQYLAILSVPTLWLIFVLQYSGRQPVADAGPAGRAGCGARRDPGLADLDDAASRV